MMGMLSSGDRLPKLSEGPFEEPFFSPICLMYSNGNSSLLAKEQVWPSRLFPFPKYFLNVEESKFLSSSFNNPSFLFANLERHLPLSLHWLTEIGLRTLNLSPSDLTMEIS
jgi:hypothetical protein